MASAPNPPPPPPGPPPPSAFAPADWQQKVIEWLRVKVPSSGTCTACGHTPVAIAPDLVTPTKLELSGNLNLAGGSYPQFMLHCPNCGHVRFFNYILLRDSVAKGDAPGA